MDSIVLSPSRDRHKSSIESSNSKCSDDSSSIKAIKPQQQIKLLPNGRPFLVDDEEEDPSTHESMSAPADNQQEWQDAKARWKGYSRKDRRFLRWQAVKAIQSKGPDDLPEEFPLVLHKATQTDAIVVMDSFPVPETIEENDLEDFVLARYFANLYTEDHDENSSQPPPLPPESPPPVSASSIDNLSPSVLPPVSLCLQGICPFLTGALKDQLDPVWLGCKYRDRQTGYECSYWIHAKCHGFPKMSKEAAKMAKGFRCPLHLE